MMMSEKINLELLFFGATAEISGARRLEVEATAGDTVGWVNEDMFPHTSTADGAAGWDTRPIPSGDTTFVVVRRAGTFNYICEIHPTMHGTIIVR
jgi:plastocyanin